MADETLEFEIISNAVKAIRDLNRFDSALAKTDANATKAARGVSGAIDKIKSSIGGVGKAGGIASISLGSFVGNLAAIGVQTALSALKNTASAFMDLSDAASNMNARLALATNEFGSYAQAQDDVRAIASATRSDMGATADLYSSIALQANELGISQAQVAQTTKSVGMAMKISGADAAASAGAIRQLGQALASGVLRGDEFNSVNEAAPRLMKAVADQMGVSKGELRALAAEGKITADVLTKALTDPKIVAGLEAEFGKIPVTFADIKTSLVNSATEIAGAISDGMGTGSSLGSFLGTIKTATDALIPVFKVLGQVIGQIVGAIKQVVSAWLDMAGSIAAEGQQSISIMEGISLTLSLIGEAAEVVGNMVSAAFEIIGTVVSTVVGTISDLFGGLWTWLIGSSGTSTTEMGNKFIGVLRAVKFVTTQIPRLFRSAFSAVTGIFADVGRAINSFFSGNFSAFDGLGGRISARMSKAVSDVAAVGSEAAGIMKDTEANARAIDRMLGRGGKPKPPPAASGGTPRAKPTSASKGSGNSSDKKQSDEEKEAEKRKKELEKAQEKYNEALAEYDQKMRELNYTAEQMAMVEARRRAGLSEDLTVHSKETDAIDAKAQAYYRLSKAKDATKEFDGERKQSATVISGLEADQAVLRNPQQEAQIRQAAAQALLDLRIAEIRATEGLSEAQKQLLINDEQRIFTLETQNAEIQRQNENTAQLAGFMGDIFESPKQAMKAFFADLMRKLLQAILQATILGEKLGGTGGGGGIGGFLKSALTSALGFRASGGSVSKGKPYIVGEKGPELMVPGRAGEVINSQRTKRMMGGGGGFTLAPNYNITLSGDPAINAQTLAQIKLSQAQQNAQIRSQANMKGWR